MGKKPLRKFEVFWTKEAENQLNDLRISSRSDFKSVLKKIVKLVEAMEQNPFQGIRKPEPLKDYYPKSWSRRINKKDRLIYRVEKDTIYIISIIGHYE